MRCNPHYNSLNKRAQRSQILVESDGNNSHITTAFNNKTLWISRGIIHKLIRDS